MKEKIHQNDIFQTAHTVILVSYSLFSVALIAESFLMGWELWAVLVAAAGLITSWVLHIGQLVSEGTRLWIYSLLMMGTFFFYGIHLTSTFDIASVMGAVLIIFIMAGRKALINLCMATYYITLGYDVLAMIHQDYAFDSLVISRIMLHIFVVAMIGWVARVVINKWSSVMVKTTDQIEVLADASERLNDFLANVSHEIRTPVNAVMGLTSVCLEKEKDPEIKKDLELISEAGKRVGEQISDILDYSEIDRRNLSVNAEEYMIFSVINDLVEEVRPYRKPNIELVIDVNPDLPAMLYADVSKMKKILWHLIVNGLKYTKSGGVYVHMTQIPQEYGINLLIEIKDTGIGMEKEQLEKIYESFYQADSGRARQVSGLGLGMTIVAGFVRSLDGFLTIDSVPGKGTTVRVSLPQRIIDNSPCMTLEDPDKLVLGGFLHFEKFPHPEVREFYNAMVKNMVQGLHLSMHRVETIDSLKKLMPNLRMTHMFVGVEEYESDIEYMEEIGKNMIVAIVADDDFKLKRGSHCRVMRKPFYCFPVISILNSSPGDLIQSEARMFCHGVRALVVDDEPMNLLVADGLFKSYGMEVSTAESGFDAIRMCNDNDYDIVFMDHMMPEMDGIEAMKRIRADRKRDHKELVIVALTANAVSSAKEMFLREGFDGFVSKPVDIVELERVLRRVLPKSMVTFEYEGDEGELVVAETLAREEETDELFDRLHALGVDTDKGLGYCQNDLDFYHKLLAEYAKTPDKKLADLKRFFEEQDWKNYAIRVHAIKSTSKMIGAASLSETARRLEDAAKKQETEILEKEHPVMLPMYEELLMALKTNDAEEESPEIMEFGPAEESEDEEIFEFAPVSEEGGSES
ncbi:MAG: response regulator [Eubacterium sp.]|nr:response regulator [Eubacterium sp.]